MPVSDGRPPLLAPQSRLAPGLAGVWLTALATLFVLTLLVGLVWIVTVNALGWFWPAPLLELRLADGATVIGQQTARETIPVATADTVAGSAHRLQLKTGNRELTGSDFRWIDDSEVVASSRPADLVRVVRSEYGDAFGRITGAVDTAGRPLDATDRAALRTLLATGRADRDRRRRLEQRLDRVRAPLTHAEEQLDLLERSSRAGSPRARPEIEHWTARVDALAAELQPELDAIEQNHRAILERLATASLELAAGDDRVEIPLGNIIEVTWPNRMSWFERLWRTLREAALFLVSEPREANTEGGVYPALFGTVLLVLLMSLAVVPLGVITAVYMTEYARQGWALRLANQAVNNLAGVPSIVFGMFGLAFFIYGVGGSIDRLLFAERLPTPTFGTGGILWASLTLALLTVPVVVVATREGLLAVPRSWREGSLALGATRWQTLRRIVLPAAMPGILTGLILAVSRAAGEVAPLMLTGAVKLAPSLPVDGVPPFLHLQRKFMHLGFHIYDVSMQSPNVEAAKPMAFATTLVLLLLVVLMNLTAIIVRRRLRRAYRGQAV